MQGGKRFALAAAAWLIANGVHGEDRLVLDSCVVVATPDAPVQIAKAAEMLRDETARRTGLHMPCLTTLPAGAVASVVVGTVDYFPDKGALASGADVPEAEEGYAVWTEEVRGHAPRVLVAGRDERGVLFGVGRLLRALHMEQGKLSLEAGFRAASAPQYRVRGHELGYRDKSNTYDAWTVAQFEQYMRDLAVFGANTIQLVVQLDRLGKEGPHMTEPVMERTAKLTRLASDYGLHVWVWMPPSESTITPETVPAAVAKCRAFFETCGPVEAVFVPGGDPGDTPPEILLPLLKDVSVVLRRSHPDAQLWLSNENMPHEWNASLFRMLSEQRPDWLSGFVFGTWVKMTADDVRKELPDRYPMVQYADITHSIECQYPAPDWDLAYGVTLGRECINPRSTDMAAIFKRIAPLTTGFITYSDGVNDDVNKFVWTVLGWDPSTPVEDALRDYGRYFFGEKHAAAAVDALLSLERNWRGPLATNPTVERTLARWRALEAAGGERLRDNWRFQMGLFRANYDAYLRRRLLQEGELEREAIAEIRRAREIGVRAAVLEARSILAEADAHPAAPELKKRCDDLGGALFRGIGIQMSVDKYGASNWERGAVLDAIDMPLSNRPWLEARFEEALAAPDEAGRLELLESAIDWEDAGMGGWYDDLGCAGREPHVVHASDWKADPGFVRSCQDEVTEVEGRKSWRKSWLNQAQTLYGEPLRMHYEGLQAGAPYVLRVTYAGRFRPTMALAADEIEVHGPLAQPEPVAPVEYPVPPKAVEDGVVDLEWRLVSGRGCQVAEVWLVRAVR